MVENNEDRDLLRRVSVVEILDQQIEDAQEEVANLSNGWKDPYPNLCLFRITLTALSRDYEDRLEYYKEQEEKLDRIYNGKPEDRNCVMTNDEARERLKNIMFLDKEVGHGKIDEEFAYYQPQQPDSIDFSDWGEDK